MRSDGPWLHLSPQFTFHFEALVVGSVEGLTALRDAINVALEKGEGTASAYASDGEGYEVNVRRTSTMAGLGRPTYLDEIARELAHREYEWLTTMARHNRDASAKSKAKPIT